MADKPLIPTTQARLSTSIQIFALDQNNRLISKPIGAVESLSEAEGKPSDPRYEIDADHPGEQSERTPGKMERSLTINRAILYDVDSILDVFQIKDKEGNPADDLIWQTKPVAIQKVEYYPDGNLYKSKTTTFNGCWIHGNPKTYSIAGTNLRIVQSVPIGYTNKTVTWTKA